MSTIDQNNLYNYQLAQYPQYIQGVGAQTPAMPAPSVQPQIPNVQLPDLYYMPNDGYKPKSFKETVKQADPMGMISPMVEHPLTALLLTVGLFKGFDVLGEHFGGEYNKSLVGKASHFGDKMQGKLSPKVVDKLRIARNKASKFLHTNSITSAIIDKPAIPDWDMPKSELHSQQMRTLQDFKEFARNIGLESEGVMKRKNIRLDKTEAEAAKKFFNVKSLSKIKDADFVNFARLKRLKLDETEIRNIISSPDASKKVEEQMLKALNLDKAAFEKIMKDTTGETIPTLEKALEKASGKLRISSGNIGWLGSFQPFSRKITSNQFYNKFHSISSAKTATGRMCAKAMQIFHRMATFGGGKLGVLFFMVPWIVNAIENTKKADKDSKVGTLMNGLLMASAWVVTIPLAVKIVYGLGGLQNIGVSKENRKKIYELTAEFKNKVNNKEFATIAEDKAARKAVKEQIKALKKSDKPQNLLVKMLRKIGSFIDIGNNGLKGRTIFQKLPNLGKNAIGVPLRFIGVLMLSSSVLDAALTKICKAIFGDYYDEIKEEEHEANKKSQEEFLRKDLQERLLKAQEAKLEAQNNPVQPDTKLQPETDIKSQPIVEPTIPPAAKEPANQEQLAAASTTAASTSAITTQVQNNLQDKYTYIPSQDSQVPKTKPEYDNYTYIPSQDSQVPKTKSNRDTYTYIPSQDSTLGKNPTEAVNKYIPAQTPANIKKTFDNSGLASALKRADRAENNAIKILSGNFPS